MKTWGQETYLKGTLEHLKAIMCTSMASSAAPFPLLKTVALIMSAMLVLASFESAESIALWNAIKNLSKPIIRALMGDDSACQTECANCGQHADPLGYSILVASLHASKEAPTFKFATPIGKRLALTNAQSFWTGSMAEYKVFLIKGDSFMVKENKEHCHLEAAYAKSTTAEQEVVLLVLSEEIPQKEMVPACFQPSDLSIPTKGTEIDVLFYSKECDRTFQDGFSVKMVTKSLKVVKKLVGNPRHLTLEGWKHVPTGVKAAVGGGGLQKRGDRQFVTSISETLQAGRTDFIHSYVWQVDTDDVLKWIEGKAAKNCVCRKPSIMGGAQLEQHPEPEPEPIKSSKKCNDECANCGEHKTPADYMVMIVHLAEETTPFTFAAAIGKRFALTSDQYKDWSYDKTKYKVLLMTGNQFLLKKKEEEQYRGIANLIFTPIPDTTGDKIVLIELTENLPHYMVPACLPTTKLESKIGGKFQVPFYSESSNKDPSALEKIVTMSQRTLSVIELVHPTGNGRILKLKDARIALSSGIKPALGGPLMHKVDATRDILFGFLEWHVVGSMFDFTHRILTVDPEEHRWIEKNAGEKCVCKQPAPEEKPKHE